jgi:hypothetical protein
MFSTALKFDQAYSPYRNPPYIGFDWLGEYPSLSSRRYLSEPLSKAGQGDTLATVTADVHESPLDAVPSWLSQHSTADGLAVFSPHSAREPLAHDGLAAVYQGGSLGFSYEDRPTAVNVIPQAIGLPHHAYETNPTPSVPHTLASSSHIDSNTTSEHTAMAFAHCATPHGAFSLPPIRPPNYAEVAAAHGDPPFLPHVPQPVPFGAVPQFAPVSAPPGYCTPTATPGGLLELLNAPLDAVPGLIIAPHLTHMPNMNPFAPFAPGYPLAPMQELEPFEADRRPTYRRTLAGRQARAELRHRRRAGAGSQPYSNAYAP